MIITPIQPTGNFSTCAVMFACVPVQFGDAYTKAETDALLAGKQKTLIAGDNITIEPDGTINSTGGGASIHNDLLQRDAADAHPIGAISGLQAELDSKLSTLSFETKYADTIARWLNVFPTSYNASVDVVNETFSVVGETIGIEDAIICLSNYTEYYSLFRKFWQSETKVGKLFVLKGRTTDNNCDNAFNGREIEIFYATNESLALYVGNERFGGTFRNTNIRKVLGKFNVGYNVSMFLGVTTLEYLDVIFTADAHLENFSQVTFDNLELLMNQAGNNNTSVTWTLHPDIFDKITNAANPDYPQWNTLATLATSKNITITT